MNATKTLLKTDTPPYRVATGRLIGLFLCFAVLLNGCTIRLVYNHLDWVIPWYVSDYITFDDAQASDFEKRLWAQLKWHRSTQLKRYAALIREIKRSFVAGFTQTDLDRFHKKLRKYWQGMIRHVAPDLANILSGASDMQIKELLENMRKKQEKFKEKYIDPPAEEVRLKKYKRMTSFLDFVIGDLTPIQEKAVEAWSYELKLIAPERLAYIRAWQSRFVQLLKKRHLKGPFKRSLQTMLYFRRNEWPKDFKEKAAFNRELTQRFFLTIEKSLTDAQREQVIENLDDLANLLEDLAQMKTE